VAFVEDRFDSEYLIVRVDPSGRAVYGMVLQPLCCWDCGFEFCQGHECLSLRSFVC